MKLKFQFKSISHHNGTYTEGVWRVGYKPTREECRPWTAFDGCGRPTEDWTLELSVRWVDTSNNNKPVTSWSIFSDELSAAFFGGSTGS